MPKVNHGIVQPGRQPVAAVNGGDTGALKQLVPIVYNELRPPTLPSGNEGRHTPKPPRVHEVYVRLAPEEVQGKPGALAVAARMMRRILVDYLAAWRRVEVAAPRHMRSMTSFHSHAVQLIWFIDGFEQLAASTRKC
jgi:hypothetical protein